MNKSTKCYLALLLAVIMFLGTITSSFSQYKVNAEQNVSGTITVTMNVYESEIQPYIKQFQKKYPNVTIEYNYLSNYDEDTKELASGKEYGDVMFVPSWVKADEYSKYYEKLGSYNDLSKKYQFLNQGKRLGNDMYGIPSAAYTSGFLYNKNTFEKAGVTEIPTTIDEFLTALENIDTYTDSIPFFTNYTSDWALQSWETYPFIDMTGDATYRNNRFVNVKDPFSTDSTHYQAYQLLYDIIYRGLCEDDITKGVWEQSKRDLNNGKIACMSIGSWAVSQFRDAGDHGEDVGFMPFPTNVNGKQYMTISTDYCYGICKNSQNKEAARAFIDFMIEESGYALDHETISIVKTDPYPESYTGMDNVILLMPESANKENEGKFDILSLNLNLTDGKEQKRVMEAAAGISQETLSDIMNDWNKRWESNRTPDMEIEKENTIFTKAVVDIDNQNLEFSAKEKSYIQNKKVLKVGYLDNLAPFSWQQNKKFKGVAADVCEVIAKNTQLQLDYCAYATEEEMLADLAKGRLDMIAGIEKTSNLTDTVRYSKEYMQYNNIIVKNSAVKSNELQDKLACFVNGYSADYLQDVKNVDHKATLEDCLTTINQKKADYTITNYYCANYYIREKAYDNVALLPMTTSTSMSLAFAADADTQLVAICNKCIYAIPDGTIDMLLMDYMDVTTEKLTLRGFVQVYPLESMLICLLIASVIMGSLLKVAQERRKSNTKQEIAAKRYAVLSELANEYVFEYNYEDEIISFDKKFEEVFTFHGDVNLRTYDGSDEELNKLIALFKEVQNTNQQRVIEVVQKNGQKSWYKLIFSTIKDKSGQPLQTIGKLVDAQEEVSERNEIEYRAMTDALTGIWNREGFYSTYKNYEEQYKGKRAVAFLDMDDFKSVNDTLGHGGGDEALILLANTLKEIFPSDAIISRFGGDEFVLAIFNIMDVDLLHLQCKQLVMDMNQRMAFNGASKHISISMGIVVSENESLDFMLEEADELLYKTKEFGKNNYLLREV